MEIIAGDAIVNMQQVVAGDAVLRDKIKVIAPFDEIEGGAPDTVYNSDDIDGGGS